MKKITLGFVCGLSFVLVAFAAASFPDVKDSDWFYPYVEAIKDWGIINGTGDGRFAPEEKPNRAQLAKMFYLLDERMDQKIDAAMANVSAPTTASGGASVMYLQKFNNDPAQCPSGWSEAEYGENWADGQNSYIRTCYTMNACSVMYLSKIGDANTCPASWSEADYGVQWRDGGKTKMRRTCYVCS